MGLDAIASADSTVMTALAGSSLADRLTIKKPVITKSTVGGNIQGTPIVLATGLPCIVMPASPSQRQMLSSPVSGELYWVEIPNLIAGIPVNIDDTCTLEVTWAGDGTVTIMFVRAFNRQEGIRLAILASLTDT